MWTRVLPGSAVVLAAVAVPELSMGAGDLVEGRVSADPTDPLRAAALPPRPADFSGGPLAGVRFAPILGLAGVGEVRPELAQVPSPMPPAIDRVLAQTPVFVPTPPHSAVGAAGAIVPPPPPPPPPIAAEAALAAIAAPGTGPAGAGPRAAAELAGLGMPESASAADLPVPVAAQMSVPDGVAVSTAGVAEAARLAPELSPTLAQGAQEKAPGLAATGAPAIGQPRAPGAAPAPVAPPPAIAATAVAARAPAAEVRPPSPVPAASPPAFAAAAAPPGVGSATIAIRAQLVTRVDGKVAGALDFEQTETGLKVKIGAIVDLLGDRFDPPTLARIKSSRAGNSYLPLAELQAQGIPISYDPVYDEFNVGREDTRPQAAGKVHMDQITTPERGIGSTGIDQIRR